MTFLGYENSVTDPESARVIILPVPFEHSTSYGKGTESGPQAIIDASPYLEFYDEELDNEPWLNGVFTAPAVECTGKPEQVMDKITAGVAQYDDDRKLIIALGGEHSVTFGLYRHYHDKYKDLSILQLDAHSDLRDIYEGSAYSHACVMRRVWELNRNIVSVGIRSQCREERDFVVDHNIKMHYAHQIAKNGLNASIIEQLSSNVYLTIDVDFFDPNVIPATGTPEPGGMLWYETLEFLKILFQTKNVVGIDVVELSPHPGHSHADFTVAKLVYKLIGYYFSSGDRGYEKS